MGFFSDLKDDLSQAVNELMPEEGAEEAEAKKNAEAEEAADDGADAVRETEKAEDASAFSASSIFWICSDSERNRFKVSC